MSDTPDGRRPTIDDPAEIRRMVEARRADEEKRREAKLEKKTIPAEWRGIHPHVLRAMIDAGDYGLGAAYRILARGRVVWDASRGSWMVFNKTHWEVDILEEASAIVEEVAERIMVEVKIIVEEIGAAGEEEKGFASLKALKNKALSAVRKLRTAAGRKNCLEFARSSHWPGVPSIAITGREFDTDPYLLPTGNRVVNLRTGADRPGRPEDYLHRYTPVEWRGIDAPRPLWEKTLYEIFLGNKTVIAFAQQVLGMALVRDVIEHVVVVLQGGGANGKSLFINTICVTLGELAAPVPVEMILAQRGVRNSAAPSPDIASLRGLALAIMSEADPGVRWSPGRAKWFTGGDPLYGRHPHDKHGITFQPSHTMVLVTNDRPGAPGQDFAFWRRMCLVEFAARFVDQPSGPNEYRADKDLPRKLKEEMPGVLAWLVEGCLMWQRNGLVPPQEVLDATAAYQTEEDLLGSFLDEYCEIGAQYKEKSTDLFDAFVEWFEANIGKSHPSQKTFGTWMVSKYERSKSKPRFYHGLRLRKTDP